MAEALASPWGSLAIAALLTAIVCAESRWMPWSPFFHVYAALALAVPFLAGDWIFGSWEVWRENAVIIAAGAACMLIWELGIATWFYERFVLGILGKAEDPAWSPSLALDLLMKEAIRHARFGARAAPAVYGAYSLLWAPLAEEIFYWGYLYGNLRPSLPFSGRGGDHLRLLRSAPCDPLPILGPPVPGPAAAWLAASTAATGLLNSWLYERNRGAVPAHRGALRREHALRRIRGDASGNSGNQNRFATRYSESRSRGIGNPHPQRPSFLPRLRPR